MLVAWQGVERSDAQVLGISVCVRVYVSVSVHVV